MSPELLETYISLKLSEFFIWGACAIFFYKSYLRTEKGIEMALAVTFAAFGLADFVEYFTRGTFPWWLWIWKIGGGLALFVCLLIRDYKRRGPVALSPIRFIAAALILAIAAACIWKLHQ